MRILPLSVLIMMLMLAAPAQAADIPAYVAAAVAAKDRPQGDTVRDADRHPAEIMTLTGVKPGDRAVDVGTGKTGYYTKILSRIVGADGKVIMFNPTWVADMIPEVKDASAAMIKAGYANIEGAILPMEAITFEQPVDLVFISQLYHDQVWKNIDIAKMNRAVFDALKPGGVYFVIDHVGPGVTTAAQIDKLHRIEPALVKAQILAAGFKLEATSDLLANPADPHTANVFEPSIRGKTDQFIFKFVKPTL